MSDAARKKATYADLLTLPENLVGEIFVDEDSQSAITDADRIISWVRAQVR